MFSPLSIPSPPEEWRAFTFELFGLQFTMYAYALCILAGIIAATVLTHIRLTRRGAEPGVVIDIALWAVPFGIVGARAYHVLSHPDDYFGGQDILSVLYIWEGGIAIFGALLGGAVGAWIGCRMTGIRFWTFADALAPGLLLAQALGRLGNWFNHELYGLPTDLPWGLEIEEGNAARPVGLPEGTLFHPTFLYEIIWNIAGAALILLLQRRFRLQWGRVFALYLIVYGAGRVIWESIRVDPSELIFGIRTNVWAAAAATVLGVILFLVQRRRHPGVEPSPYRPGREWAPAAADVDSDEIYSDDDGSGIVAAASTDTGSVKPATSGAKPGS